MPIDLFIGKSSVQTNVYVFRVGEAHQKDDTVKFIDFSNDGYTRTNRKKASVNLRDTDNAKGRYAELVDLVRFGKKKLNIFTEKEYYEDRDGCPSICVKLFETNGNFIMFSVENHYRKIGYANGGLLSTKSQPAEHGIGLKNVRRICGKYGGVFDLDIGTNLFCVNICLPNSSAKIAE